MGVGALSRTRAIWQQLAPWVSLLPASEMLVPHVHARNAKIDFQHWCLDTYQSHNERGGRLS